MCGEASVLPRTAVPSSLFHLALPKMLYFIFLFIYFYLCVYVFVCVCIFVCDSANAREVFVQCVSAHLLNLVVLLVDLRVKLFEHVFGVLPLQLHYVLLLMVCGICALCAIFVYVWCFGAWFCACAPPE